jgi:hypothetical protein
LFKFFGFAVFQSADHVKRGEYLANHVSLCVDCHSQRDYSKWSGPLVPGTLGEGGEAFMKAGTVMWKAGVPCRAAWQGQRPEVHDEKSGRRTPASSIDPSFLNGVTSAVPAPVNGVLMIPSCPSCLSCATA